MSLTKLKLSLEIRTWQLYWHSSLTCDLRIQWGVCASVPASPTKRKVASASVRGRSKS